MWKIIIILVFFAVIFYSVVKRNLRTKNNDDTNNEIQEKSACNEKQTKTLNVVSNNLNSDKQSTEDDLNNEKRKKIPKKTYYSEDSLLLLTYFKERCNCSEPETFGDDEKERLEKKFADAVNNVFINRLRSNSICIYNPSDGIEQYPYGNWIEVEKSVKIKDAINLYLELKDYVKNNKEEVKCSVLEYFRKDHTKNHEEKIKVWRQYEIWRSNLTFFIVDMNIDLSGIDKKLIEKLRLNNIHLVAQEDKLKYIDVLDATKYILEYYEEPCGVDWSGTVGYYNLRKIDSEAKSDEQKLSDELLCGIFLHCEEKEKMKKYIKDSSLTLINITNDSSSNLINIRIPIDKNSLYFLTVRINASTGMIKKFSFDIESASDTHYEFDIFGAVKIREMCILNLHDSKYDYKYNYEKPLDALMSEYLNKQGESSLISLIESIATAVFHLD